MNSAVIAFAVIAAAQWGVLMWQAKRFGDILHDAEVYFANRYDDWAAERKQLLDRIQASSYAEYKTQEIRLVKAQNAVDEKPSPIEPV